MKTKHGKRALSFLLALVFAFYLIPTQALALDVPEEDLERLEAMDPRFLMEETGEPGEAESADSGTMLEEIPDRRDAFCVRWSYIPWPSIMKRTAYGRRSTIR